MMTRAVFIHLAALLLTLPSVSLGKAVLEKSSGSVYRMEERDSTWKTVEKGFEIRTNTKIKTDGKSIALLRLDKGISLYLRSDTVILLRSVEEKIRIELIQGACQITSPSYADDFILSCLLRRMKIESRNCLIKNLNNILLVSVFDHRVILLGTEKGFVVSEGKGLTLQPGQEPSEFFPLPAPPVIEYPESRSIITPGIDLKWGPVSEAMLYRLEISPAADFVNPAVVEEMNQTVFPVESLAEGSYFWRVSSIDRRNLEGVFLESSLFSLQKGTATLVIQKKETNRGTAFAVSSNADLLPEEPVPGENTTNSIILGTMILLSVIILIIL